MCGWICVFLSFDMYSVKYEQHFMVNVILHLMNGKYH